MGGIVLRISKALNNWVQLNPTSLALSLRLKNGASTKAQL